MSRREDSPMPYPEAPTRLLGEPEALGGGDLEPDAGALQRLIKERLSATKQSYRSAAAAANLPKSTLFELATKRLKRKLDAATIEAVAVALRVPIPVVVAAEQEELGVSKASDAPPSELATLLAMIADLDVVKRHYVRALVEAMWESVDADGTLLP